MLSFNYQIQALYSKDVGIKYEMNMKRGSKRIFSTLFCFCLLNEKNYVDNFVIFENIKKREDIFEEMRQTNIYINLIHNYNINYIRIQIKIQIFY